MTERWIEIFMNRWAIIHASPKKIVIVQNFWPSLENFKDLFFWSFYCVGSNWIFMRHKNFFDTSKRGIICLFEMHLKVLSLCWFVVLSTWNLGTLRQESTARCESCCKPGHNSTTSFCCRVNKFLRVLSFIIPPDGQSGL